MIKKRYLTVGVCLILIFLLAIFFFKFQSHKLSNTTYINVNDYGIYGDGRDVTDKLQSLLNKTNSNSVRELIIPNGTYIISTPIKLKKGITIRGETNTVIKLSNNFKSNRIGQGFFYADSVNSISFKHIKFDGNKKLVKKNSKNNFALYFKNSSFISISDCKVINLNGQGNNLNSAFSFVGNSNHILLDGNVIRNSNGGAIFFQGSFSIAIRNKSYNIKDVAYVANGSGSNNVVFKDNIVSNASSGGIGIENGASKITIENNQIKNFTDGYGIGVLSVRDSTGSMSSDITINNNIINKNLGQNPCNGIAIVKANNVFVYNNTVTNVNNNNKYNNSIYLGEKTDNITSYNNIISNTNVATFVNNSRGNNIKIYNNNIK